MIDNTSIFPTSTDPLRTPDGLAPLTRPRPSPSGRRITTSVIAAALAIGLPALGCDRDRAKTDDKKAEAGKKEGGSDAKAAGHGGANPVSEPLEPDPAPELGELLAGSGPPGVHLWLTWDGSIWRYNDTDPSLLDPPTAWSQFSDPARPEISKSYAGATALRVFVNNTTAGDIQATFEQTGPLESGKSHVVTLSDDYGSWDDWHVRVGDDPVFHIKKGSTAPGAPLCQDFTLRYLGASRWEYGPTGGQLSPVTGDITCTYEGESPEDFDVTIENGSGDPETFTVSEKRPIGTRPYADPPPEFPWNNIAWQIGEDPGFGATNDWKIQVDGTTTVVALVVED